MDHAVAYETLGVSREATPQEIRAAYRRRAFETHPDRTAGSAAAFQAVSDAYRSLSDSTAGAEHEPGPTPAPDESSRVPATDAAKVLFEYLSDLASEMILNGATPDAVVSFLAREGCPETVARALEQDLRTRVQPVASESPRTPPGPDQPEPQPPDESTTEIPSDAAAPSQDVRRRATSRAIWPALGLATAALLACTFAAWRFAAASRSSEPRSNVATAVPVAAAPLRPSDPEPAAPLRTSPTRPRSRQGAAPQPRAAGAESLKSMSSQLDAERDALEADRNRLASEAAALEAERRRIDAAQAALGAGSDEEQVASLRRQEAGYEARLAAARRMEKALQRRVRDLNAKISAYNDRVRRART